MSAKSKAFQAMAVIGVAAITLTLTNSSSENRPTVTKKEQAMPAVVAKPEKKKKTPANSVQDQHGVVPGYSNPDESSK